MPKHEVGKGHNDRCCSGFLAKDVGRGAVQCVARVSEVRSLLPVSCVAPLECKLPGDCV